MNFWDYEYLNIPINSNGVCELNGNSDLEWKDVFSIKLTRNDVENMSNLINDFNSTFDILIDLSEEERLENENLKSALAIAEKHHAIAPNEIRPSLQKVIVAITKAIEFNTFVEFDL